jgi:Kef-type K+ transport system membrane component KefB
MNPLISLGIVFLIAYIASHLFDRFIPRDLVYVLVGVFLGLFGIIPESMMEGEYTIALLTMGMIAFLLSPFLGRGNLKNLGAKMITISVIESLFTFFVVFLGFCAYFSTTGSIDVPSALLLGSISSLTSPAVALMQFREYGTKGPLTKYSTGMLVFDEVSGLVIFIIVMSVSRVMLGISVSPLRNIALAPIIEILAPITIGILCGLALSWFFERANDRNKDSVIITTLGFILLTAGIAEALTISVLFTALVMGIVVVNRSQYDAAAHLDVFMGPAFLIFFVIAGANLDLEVIPGAWPIIIVYIALRAFGKIFGTKVGAMVVGAPEVVRKLAGYTMLAQGGTDIGLAFMVSVAIPQMSSMLTIVLGAAAIFEIIAPFTTRMAILRSGEDTIKP